MTPCLPPVSRTLLAFRGPDAVRYLNGQLTQDTRELGERSLPACVTDAKGRLQFYVHLSQGPDGALWIDAPAEQREELEARLSRYLIADDVEIEDLSDRWQLLAAASVPPAPPAPDAGAHHRSSERFFPGGADCWLPAGAPLPDGLSPLSSADAEAQRIARRLPAWGAELIPGILPPEAGLDRSAISYRKGCYIGQEVLSRIKTAGKLNRRLAAFEITLEGAPGARVPAGSPLRIGEGEGAKEVGHLTSISPLPDPATGHFPALGYLEKAGFDAESFHISLPSAEDPAAIATAKFVAFV